ncbi:hypothetical protein F5890DRAFT_134963 [Lentinula detonsa]|uniref:F-box domain-containing protein n=1 Tax=Lentinula detonsa TaxID=2804962 RepID=A0AA38UWF7_9AGAR|nr:hypothetical protein F5890DRAFT_134963 [Lentinula detonsa]
MPTSIDSLPSELLLIIFEHTLPLEKDPLEDPDNADAVSPTWPDIFDLKNGPWVLGQVCRRWRSIALSIPQLWSTFYVRLPRRKDSAVDVLQAWLGRSGNCPLQFQITATLGFCGHQSGYALLTTLARTSSRWQSVDLVDVSMKFLDTLAMQREIRSSSFPLLKELSLRSRDWDIELDNSPEFEDLSTAYEVFFRAPNLVTLINFDTLSLSTFKFPWNQLTTYIGSDASHAIDHLEIMLLCPNLVECNIAFGRTHTWPTIPLISLKQLKKWTIRIRNSSHDIYSLLSQTTIEVPALQELILLAEQFSLTPILDLFRPVLISSACSLHYLELSGNTVTDSLARFLESVATITRLRIWLNRLTVLPLLERQKTLVPMLEILDFGLSERADIYGFDMNLLATVVRSRRQSVYVHSIRQVNIVVDGSELNIMGTHVFPPIMEVLQEEGLDIHVCKRNEKLLQVK